MNSRKPTERRDLWPDERTEMCKKLWLAGHSASLCASAIGGNLTRSAIIGKMNRMGYKREAASGPLHTLAYPSRGAVKIGRRKGQPAPAFVGANWKDGQPQPPTRAEVLRNPVESPNAKVWLKRVFGECAFPFDGAGADTRSCCNATGGRTYCPGHMALMFNGCPKPNTAFAEAKPRRSPNFKEWAA